MRERYRSVEVLGRARSLGLVLVLSTALAETGHAQGTGGLTSLDAEGAREQLSCRTPESAAPPPGEYVDQGLRLEYERLVPLPDPARGVDPGLLRVVVSDARRLEQLYHDATSGNRRAAWLVCQLEVGARSSGREVARQLASLACQTLELCSFSFEKLPFSPGTASGRRSLRMVSESFDAEARRLALAEEIMGKALGLLVGAQMAARLRAPPPVMMRKPPPPTLSAAVLEEVRGTGKVRSFRSFEAFKHAMGPAGPGKEWHHIVEQTPGNVARFGPEALHNTTNVIAIDETLHREISRYYSSKQATSGHLVVRKWLSTQSFEAQQAFGIKTLRDVRAIP